MSLALIAALPFLGAILSGLTIRFGRNACAFAVFAVTAMALTMVCAHTPSILAGHAVRTQIKWLPSLGMNANFMLDGLGLLFAILILGIGLLIILYARFYLSNHDPIGKFFTYLMLFQGAMLGIVLSDNILLLLIFWELTSLSSFLLIGYWTHLSDSRQGARMALAVTGGGGLALLAGMLILGQIAGSYDLSIILTQRAQIQASDWYLPALILILIGAFTKSAQFPFHFWLPHAMAAPTPVSAYLHSATMVKAGLFLLARLWPVLAGTEIWFSIVATTGLITMLLGATVALFKDDLKAILAYSTISQLGLITFLLGLGTKAAAVAAVFHILCHATFKAALFMVAGIVDHATHTRDIRQLGGLRRLMPVTFGIAVIATLAMAGVPPLNGFLSKELMLEQAALTQLHGAAWLVPTVVTMGAALSVAYCLRFLKYGFLGTNRKPTFPPPHDPGFGLWLAPCALAALIVAIGLAPMALSGWLVDAAATSVVGNIVHAHMKLWHGIEAPALWMSVAAFGGGFLLLGRLPGMARRSILLPLPDAKALFDLNIGFLAAVGAFLANRLHDGSLTRYIAIAVIAIVGLGSYGFVTGPYAVGTRPLTPIEFAPMAAWLLLTVAIVCSVLWHRQRLTALLTVGVVGLIISVGFAYLAAPDLALTQITVEVVTVILMLIALQVLPKQTPQETPRWRRARDAVIASTAGVAAAALAYALMLREPAFAVISAFHLAQSQPRAGGTNAVNTIIVDFRGFDTYGEIIVLGIAGLIIFALGRALSAGSKPLDRPIALIEHTQPSMLAVATRIILPFAILVAIYLFLRGHNQPGGGFVAGLVFAIALVMQYMASGQDWTDRRQPIDYHAMLGLGILIASAAGLGSWLAGRPFLTSSFTYVSLPPLDKFELATATIFDLGVFFCVLGAVMLAIASLSRLAAAR